MEIIAILALFIFLPGLLIQVALYRLGGSRAMALVLAASIGLPLIVILQHNLACSDWRNCNSPGDAFAVVSIMGLIAGWCLPTVGILIHWGMKRPLEPVEW